MADNTLRKNIIFNLSVYFVFQIVFYLTIVMLTPGFPVPAIWLFFIATILFHAFVMFMLLGVMLKFFVREPEGIPLKKVNIANRITLFRISSIPTIFFLFLAVHLPLVKWILIVFVVIIFVTDFLDGILARLLKQTTRIGKYLDSSGDYLILIFTSVLFFLFRLIPLWLFIIIILRIFSIAAAVIILSLVKQEVVYTISFLGKVSIFALMTLLALHLLPLFIKDSAGLTMCLTVCDYVTGALLAVSFLERVILIPKALRSAGK